MKNGVMKGMELGISCKRSGKNTTILKQLTSVRVLYLQQLTWC